ncbi:uncharacterized protein LOC125032685 [Penaeus chinensis]|uniref:uncharacterized protein LOC125032685 n=1 Tax=Penaeus chinensis TaxID=139456 RepID=UPI001FB5972D|nr:uncharacterized protein LOC125032685 [Penaeus chinensis]
MFAAWRPATWREACGAKPTGAPQMDYGTYSQPTLAIWGNELMLAVRLFQDFAKPQKLRFSGSWYQHSHLHHWTLYSNTVLTGLTAPVLLWDTFKCEMLNATQESIEWDILELLSINGSQTGVSAARGPIPDTPAWRLRAVYDNIQIEPAIVPKIASTLHDEISFYFVYKQHKKTLGSLLSINLPGRIKPWLQVISNLKTERLNVFYHIKEDAKTHQASFELPEKVGWTWTRILVSVKQTQMRIWINCADYDKQKLAGHIDLEIPSGGLIYFRQEPGLKNKLIGSIQMAKILNYSVNDRVWKCTYDAQFGPSWRPPLLG